MMIYFDPSISSGIIRFNEICSTASTPTTDGEQNLMRYSRSSYLWCHKIDILQCDHLKVIEKF